MYGFVGTCIDNPFHALGALEQIIDNAREITKRTFLSHCAVVNDIQADMIRFPHDYTFYKYQGIYFFDRSAIEYFYCNKQP